MAESQWIATSMPQVAEFFGVSPTAVQRDWRRQGMPGEPGRYPLDEIAQWKIQREREQNKPKISDEQKSLRERLDEAEVRKAEADAELKETKSAQIRGDLVSRVEVKARLFSMLTELRVLIEQLPKQLASSFPPENRSEITADVEHRVRLFLKNLANKKNDVLSGDTGD